MMRTDRRFFMMFRASEAEFVGGRGEAGTEKGGKYAAKSKFSVYRAARQWCLRQIAITQRSGKCRLHEWELTNGFRAGGLEESFDGTAA